MRTIQEVLRTYNRKLIVDEYIFTYGPHLWDMPDDCNLFPREIKERIKKNIDKTIDHILNATPIPNEKDVLYAYHCVPGKDLNDVAFSLTDITEEWGEMGPKNYSFILAQTEEIAGYHVSDAYTTQYYLTELLTWFIHEASFFGWEREDVEKEAEILQQRMDDSEEEYESFSVEDIINNCLEDGEDWVPELRDEKEEEDEFAVTRKIWEFNKSCQRKEIKECLRLLKGGDKE